MLSLVNPRLAGSMLPGNRSMFLETDGSLAWLYHCPLVHSPLHTMDQCYDRIPILYEGQIQFVDAITRQAHPAANIQNCTDGIKNVLKFHMDQEDSWYTLTPGIVYQDRPAVFGPKNFSPVAVHSFPGSQHTGMYTRSEFSSFWESILISAASRSALKKIRKSSLSFQTATRTRTVFRIILLEQISIWITWSHPISSNIGSWIHLDQLHTFLNTTESISPCFYFSNL